MRQSRLEALLEPVHDAATRFCLRLCTTRQDAEDLYHDAVLAAWHGLGGLKDERHFKPWFFRIIANRFRNQLRRQRLRRWIWPASPNEPSGSKGDPAPHPCPPTFTCDPRGQLDARRWLDRAMRSLSASERSLIILCELEGYPIAEIAQIYGVPEGTIKARLSRARARMRKAIAEQSAPTDAAADAKSEVNYAMQSNQSTAE